MKKLLLLCMILSVTLCGCGQDYRVYKDTEGFILKVGLNGNYAYYNNNHKLVPPTKNMLHATSYYRIGEIIPKENIEFIDIKLKDKNEQSI